HADLERALGGGSTARGARSTAGEHGERGASSDGQEPGSVESDHSGTPLLQGFRQGPRVPPPVLFPVGPALGQPDTPGDSAPTGARRLLQTETISCGGAHVKPRG